MEILAGMRPEIPIKNYVCHRTTRPPAMNGRLDSPAWQRAERSPRFVDMVTAEPAFFDTQAAALWDDEYLYVGFWIEEPFVRARLTERDSLISRRATSRFSSTAAIATTSSRSTHSEPSTKCSSSGRTHSLDSTRRNGTCCGEQR